MLSSLLDIQDRIMNQPEKYAQISTIALADDFADYLVEVWVFAGWGITEHIKESEIKVKLFL